jgi:hypothetical protein
LGDFSQTHLRAILNFIPGSQGRTLPLGWNLSSRGNVHPFVHPQGWTLSTAFEEWMGEQRIPPPGDKIHPWGQLLSQGVKLRMGLWSLDFFCQGPHKENNRQQI